MVLKALLNETNINFKVSKIYSENIQQKEGTQCHPTYTDRVTDVMSVFEEQSEI